MKSINFDSPVATTRIISTNTGYGSKENQLDHSKPWPRYQLYLFRFIFVFLSFLIIPIDWKIYNELFSVNWLDLHFHDLFRLSKYQPDFFDVINQETPVLGKAGYANWALGLVIAAIGSVIWSVLDKKNQEHTFLYHSLRVAVRYRLAVALITYGFFKFFPLQMPYPSLSNLLTNYGDFYAWKIYFQTVGITPNYQSFLGFVEILAALLIFNRKTVTFGVGLVIGFLGNVAAANGFYQIGEQVFSSFLVLLAAFLFAHDIPRLWNLLVNEKFTYANKFIIQYQEPSIQNARLLLKSAFLFFIGIYGYKTYESWLTDPYKIPKTKGLNNAYGLYDVSTFIHKKDSIPYSNSHPTRWQNVVFEKWSTLSIKVNRPVKIDASNAEVYHKNDIDRNYELAGFAGRHYFYYEADTINKILNLQNKNRHHHHEQMQLKYSWQNDSTMVLQGVDENKDSVFVILKRINKKFLMLEGRRRPVKI